MTILQLLSWSDTVALVALVLFCYVVRWLDRDQTGKAFSGGVVMFILWVFYQFLTQGIPSA